MFGFVLAFGLLFGISGLETVYAEGVDFTKPESDILGIVGINVCIFDESENCITLVKEEDDEKNTGSMCIGLDQLLKIGGVLSYKFMI